MDGHKAQAEILFGHKKVPQIRAAEVPASIAIASLVDRAEIRGEFFIGNMDNVIKLSRLKNIFIAGFILSGSE